MKKIFTKLYLLFSLVVLSASLLTGCVSTSKKANKSKNSTPLHFDSSIRQGIFENGMSYFVQHNEEPKNRIVLRLVVKAGSCMEEDDQKGVAHFIEHLAFNGTEHFEKSAIVDYFEKIGMNFGADLNAYTSFEETVYKLEIPADDPQMLETALLILHDWACAITFPQEEIDKERGVVTEEWRLRQGLSGRITDAQLPFLFKDSRFEERLPIGDMDIIKNISRERILDFYKKWYRPELMSVIVVGDQNIDTLENAVKSAMEIIPSSESKITTVPYKVPVSTKKEILVFKDPEQKYTVMRIFNQIADWAPRASEEDAKQNIIEEIASEIFNSRMDEITNTSDSKWLDAASGLSSLSNFTHLNYIGVVPKTDIFTECFKAFLDEYDRFLTFGVTDSEVNRLKEHYLSIIEQDYTNKDKVSSDTRADYLINYVTTGKIVISEEDVYDIYKKKVSEITRADINKAISTLFASRGTKMIIIAPDSAADIPLEDELLEIWENYKNPELTGYVDDVADDKLMERPSSKGKIINKKEIPELGAKQYEFENGIKIITKKTDFEVNRLNLSFESKGGLNLVDDQDIPSANVCVNYAILSGINGMTYSQLLKKLTVKQVSLGVNIKNTSENFSGSCKSDDFETLAQLLTLFVTQPQFTKDAWQTLIQNQTEEAKNYGVQPEDAMRDKIMEILYNDIRHAPMTLDYVSKMNPEAAEKIYRQRFSNPADFIVSIVGDFDEDKLIEICSYYFGSMKTTAEREETKYIYYNFPKGKTAEKVKKGLEEKAEVFIALGGDLPVSSGVEETFEDRELMTQLSNLMDIRLREVIREDKSGSYNVWVNGNVDGYPERYYRFTVDFGCEPGRAQELTDEIIVQLEKMKTEEISQDYIDKLQETYRRNIETSLRNNNWWMSRIKAELVYTYEPLWFTSEYERIIEKITAENLQALAKKYFDSNNYVSVFLLPEK